MKLYGIPHKRGSQDILPAHRDPNCKALATAVEVIEIKPDRMKRRKPCRWCCPDANEENTN